MPAATRHIYYFCPDTDLPYGGVKKIYQHVDLLNKLGHRAYVVHNQFGFRCSWFQNKTPLAYIMGPNEPLAVSKEGVNNEFLPQFSKHDVLVVPEMMAYDIVPHASKHGLFCVIFNQGAYLTFRPIPFPQGVVNAGEPELPSPYEDPNLLGVFVVSEDSEDYLRFAFPALKIFRIHNALDTEIFSFQGEKKKQIAYMPRKCPEDIRQIVHLIRQRGLLKDWDFISIGNMTEKEVAQVLRDSAIFMSTSYEEGCPLPPQEALLCGCIVIGYDGGGGREYLKEPYAYTIQQGDIVLFAQAIEQVALNFDVDRNFYMKRAKAARDFIAKEYSAEKEQKEIKHAWNTILQQLNAKTRSRKKQAADRSARPLRRKVTGYEG